ncbi:lecithin retinol acyltransferase family protein [Laribacter hongkongensis]|uniref:lecithin retinol acyltransferase family protein n=1 Tax=Laribacter hongkongensis TaxID=168471 RepID=UPI0028320342|nr:lecithin retinol acyltransferase family protein [Laribacter hongkongensis]
MCFAGRRQPHLLFNNCEHFVTWCIQGRAESRQMSMAATTLGSAALPVRALPLLCPSRWPDPFLTAPVPGLGRLIQTASSGRLLRFWGGLYGWQEDSEQHRALRHITSTQSGRRATADFFF